MYFMEIKPTDVKQYYMKSYVLSSDYVRTSTDNVESKYGDVHLSLRGAPTVLFSCKSVLTKERTKALFSFFTLCEGCRYYNDKHRKYECCNRTYWYTLYVNMTLSDSRSGQVLCQCHCVCVSGLNKCAMEREREKESE